MDRLLVLFGGDSPEREVSLRSGAAVASALRRSGYETLTADISYAYETGGPTPPSEADFKGSPKDLPSIIDRGKPSVVLPIFHGGYGEDGTIQSFLELWEVPYASPPPFACYLSMDKYRFKRLLIAEGIPTPPFTVIERTDPLPDPNLLTERLRRSVGFPCVLKPYNQGSTIGSSVVGQEDPDALMPAVLEALRYADVLIVEKKIVGSEVTVGVLGRGANARPLPAVQIVPRTPFFDYRTKYTPALAEHKVPPDLPTEVIDRSVETAVRVHRLLGCRAVTRTDIMCDHQGQIYVLELNAIPGMTEVSLVPEMARLAGLGFEGLLQALIEEALEVGREQKERVYK